MEEECGGGEGWEVFLGGDGLGGGLEETDGAVAAGGDDVAVWGEVDAEDAWGFEEEGFAAFGFLGAFVRGEGFGGPAFGGVPEDEFAVVAGAGEDETVGAP